MYTLTQSIVWMGDAVYGSRYLIQTVGIQQRQNIVSGQWGHRRLPSRHLVAWPTLNNVHTCRGLAKNNGAVCWRGDLHRGGTGKCQSVSLWRWVLVYRIHESFGINRTAVQHQLQDAVQRYDYVIFGVTHRGEWQKQGICGAQGSGGFW